MVDSTMTDEQLREAALKRLKKRRDFRNHLVTYVIINAFLTLIWYFTDRDGYFWPMWVMIGWGIGLAFNAWEVYGRKDISESEIQSEMDKLRGSGPDNG